MEYQYIETSQYLYIYRDENADSAFVRYRIVLLQEGR